MSTTTHKLIGGGYLLLALLSGLLGGSLSGCMRLSLRSVQGSQPVYHCTVTLHGIVMVFFVVMPALVGSFGNGVLPLTLAAGDLALPRVNALSLWLLLPAVLLGLFAQLVDGGPRCGGTMYAPLASSRVNSGTRIELLIIRLHLGTLSRLLGATNLLATLAHTRLKGLSFDRCNLYPGTLALSVLLLVLALPVLAAGLTMLLLDRTTNARFFDPSGGGDPVLFGRLFWFFGHPEVYVLILPAFGLTTTSGLWVTGKADGFGTSSMLYAVASIGLVGVSVWGHHLYTTGLDVDSRGYFTAATLVIGLPTGLKVFNWVLGLGGLSATHKLSALTLGLAAARLTCSSGCHRSHWDRAGCGLQGVCVDDRMASSVVEGGCSLPPSPRRLRNRRADPDRTPSAGPQGSGGGGRRGGCRRWQGSTVCWVNGLLWLFTLGGLTGVALASSRLACVLHDSYFVVGHFHYVLSMGALYGILLALRAYWPQLMGYSPNALLATAQFWGLFLGVNVVFMPHHWVGLAGMPRRYPDYSDTCGYLNSLSTGGYLLTLTSAPLLMALGWDSVVARRCAIAPPSPNTLLDWAHHSPPSPHSTAPLPLG